MYYDFIPMREGGLVRLTKHFQALSELVESTTIYRRNHNQARNEAKGAQEAKVPNEERIAKCARLAFGAELAERESRRLVAKYAVDVQLALRSLMQSPDPFEEMNITKDWQKNVFYVDCVTASELLLRAIFVVADRRIMPDEPFGTKVNALRQTELRQTLYPNARALLQSLPELPFWFGRDDHEEATQLLAECICTAWHAKGVGMFVKLTGIDAAEVTLVEAYLKQAGWCERRKEAEPHMNYASLEVFMPPRKAPSFR